jgi:UDP-N-acetylglucosamine:LPS N-acetylglucosamine transferase
MQSGASALCGARVLILCADVGEGHVTAARALASRLRAHADVEAVELRADLEVLGRRFGRFMDRGFHAHLDGIGQPGLRLARLSYELGYRVFFERPQPRRAAHLALAALGAGGLRQTIRGARADVVVTEFPVLSAALGQLRAMGRLAVPVCSSISDPAGLWYWAHPGIDLHLLSWPESLAEVERIAGPGRAAVVHPLVDPRVASAPSRPHARRALGLPDRDAVVVVSGGGWGVGDLEGAADVVLAAVPEAHVVCLAGRSDPVRRRLLARYAGEPRAHVLGFTDRMPELLAAADLLIHTTGGTTALEARIAGCRLINFDVTVARVRAHARAVQEQGLAQWAPDRARLAAAVRQALAQKAPPRLRIDALPDAADLVLELLRPDGANHRAAAASAGCAGAGT